MKTDYLRYFLRLVLIMLITWTISCSGKSGKAVSKVEEPVKEKSEEVAVQLVKMVSPEENGEFKLNAPVGIVLVPESKEIPDSVQIWFDGVYVGILKSMPWEYTVPPSSVAKCGRKSLKIIAYKGSVKPQIITRFILVYSDTKPARNSYRIINSYLHDKDAFTQGLVYDDGVFYEGTGEPGTSYLRKVDPETGKVLFQIGLDRALFGEGVAILGNRIFQLTWRSKVGFVYDKSTMKLLNKIYYQTEGWGLTTMGEKLVLSDGTNILYIMDPDQFSVISTIEVYDSERKVDQLNELEYINGEIWANVWMTDLIARIDPLSGKVIAYIDLKGIISEQETDLNKNVLNGIAYDKTGNRIFVTGKNWPKLYEIAITK